VIQLNQQDTGGAMMSAEKDSMLRVSLHKGSRMNGRYHRWTSSTNAGSKCYHIKHSKIRSGEYVNDHIAKRDGTKF